MTTLREYIEADDALARMVDNESDFPSPWRADAYDVMYDYAQEVLCELEAPCVAAHIAAQSPAITRAKDAVLLAAEAFEAFRATLPSAYEGDWYEHHTELEADLRAALTTLQAAYEEQR